MLRYSYCTIALLLPVTMDWHKGVVWHDRQQLKDSWKDEWKIHFICPSECCFTHKKRLELGFFLYRQMYCYWKFPGNIVLESWGYIARPYLQHFDPSSCVFFFSPTPLRLGINEEQLSYKLHFSVKRELSTHQSNHNNVKLFPSYSGVRQVGVLLC